MANKVTFLTGTQQAYSALESRDANTLYFLTDTLKIMKGDADYTSSVLIAESFPEAGQIQGKLYIVGTTGKIWNGKSWTTVFEQRSIPQIVNDLTTGGADKALSAEQGKVLKAAQDSHAGTLASATAGHVKSGGDVEIANGLITVKKIGGTDFETIKSGLEGSIATKAPINNPTFTGNVVVPNPDADNEAANKGYVDSKIAANDSMRFKGTLGTGGTITALPASFRVGDTYRVITEGTYAGVKCEVGDLVIAMATKTEKGTDADWTIAQTNIDGAVVGPASATDATVVLFDGATGKRIKGSTITLTQLQAAITNNHTHANKDKLDSYDKTQTELLATAKSEANSLVTTHASTIGNTSTAGHLKIGTTAADAAAGNHGHNLTSLLDVLLTDGNAPTDGQVLYYDGSAKKWKAKTVASVDISGKLDKVTASRAEEVITANADGSVKVSGKKIGGATLAGSPNANTLATEAAVKAFVDANAIVWSSIE